MFVIEGALNAMPSICAVQLHSGASHQAPHFLTQQLIHYTYYLTWEKVSEDVIGILHCLSCGEVSAIHLSIANLLSPVSTKSTKLSKLCSHLNGADRLKQCKIFILNQKAGWKLCELVRMIWLRQRVDGETDLTQLEESPW